MTRDTATARIPDTERWSSPAYPVFAATGTAAGLGALWLFPSLVRQYGGGAFVLAYLAAMLLVGWPLLLAELSLGRIGGPDPLRAFLVAHRQAPAWSWAGLPIALTATILLTACGLFGGWSLDFAWSALAEPPSPAGGPAPAIAAGPLRLLAAQAVFIGAVAGIMAGGLRHGVERTLHWVVPAVFALLLALVCFGMVTNDHFGQSLALLVVADFSRLGASGIVAALGLALITVAAGCGAMLGLGAHACRATSLAQVAVTVVVVDVVIALLAALAILPVVLESGVEPADGAALPFVALPPAFARTSGGGPLAAVYFTCAALSALAAAVSLCGPVVGSLQGRLGLRRPAAVKIVAAGCWSAGAAVTVLGSLPA